uniref:SCY domain-containing protein n=1 Tax=Gongylonema pulchrum TaxID=637853 RepID=A0A183E985_9BILA
LHIGYAATSIDALAACTRNTTIGGSKQAQCCETSIHTVTIRRQKDCLDVTGANILSEGKFILCKKK